MTIIIHVPIEPVPFARAGASGKRRFTPKRQSEFMGQFRMYAQRAMEGRAPLEGPVEMIARFVYVAPASWSKKRRAEAHWKASKPDADNLAKIVKDSIGAVVYHDDAQVASLTVQKVYGERAEIVVTVSSLEAA